MMIYTITLNPSCDYIVSVDNLTVGSLNRTTAESCYPGGKGINVSLMLKQLGYDSIALGFIAGPTGRMLDSMLRNTAINTKFIECKSGITRINTKIREKTAQTVTETEINGHGPCPDQSEIAALTGLLSDVHDDDVIILSGSIPSSLNIDGNNLYLEIADSIQNNHAKLIVDISGNNLLELSAYHPFLVKPNKDELEELFDVRIDEVATAFTYARKLRQLGARNVLVSLGGDGAILVCEDGHEYTCSVPKGHVIGTTGSGDSMIAGFLAEYQRNGNYESALKMAVAAGSASAYSEWLADGEDVRRLYNNM